MIKLYLLIGKDKLFLYEKKDRQYTRQYVEGSPYFSYDLRRAKDAAETLLKALENEYNLSGTSEIDLAVIENRDPQCSEVMKAALGDNVVETLPLGNALKSAIQRLRREKKEKIDELGVNFDGVHYKLAGDSLLEGPFSLLGYPLSEDKLMNLAG